MENVRTRIIQILSDVCVIPPNEIEMHHKLDEDLGMDSLDIIEFTAEIEEEFEVSLSGIDLYEIKTVNDIFAQIKIYLSPTKLYG